ncbi:D-hexose-6-phosphate mutarotase, partial [Micrococcus sp.]|uniref:D-hexose-6-phosphate mutarotase n=1 Tax=Micrococcus sp. TaxID=1271 RepID=UPI0026DCF1CE
MTIELPASVSLVTGPSELPLLHITNSRATVEIFLTGAHISGFAPAGHRNVLFMSRETQFEEGKALRGGIPICGPWFGPGRDGNSKPAHGFFRNAVWEVTSASDDGEETTVELTLPPSALKGVPGAQGWPADATVVYRVTVGTRLTAALTVTAGDAPLDLQAALHSYFEVADVRRIRIEGLAGASYLDKLTQQTHTQEGPVTISAETDRVYNSEAECVVVDPAHRRSITVAKAG